MAGPAPALDAGPTDEYRAGGWSGRYVAIIVIMVLMGELGYLTSAYPVNALPQIGAAFKTSQVVWIPTIYFLVAALVSTIIGTLADRFGKKRLLVINLALAIVGLLISTFAPSFAVMLIGRVLQAPILTFPFLLPSLARDIFPTRTIPMAASLAVTGAGLLGIPSQIFSGDIIEHLGFRSVFWLPAIFAVVLLGLFGLVVPESHVRQRIGRIDLVGAFLLGGGVASALVGVSFGPSWGWTSGRVLGAIIAGALLVLAWTFQANRVTHPLVNLRELGSAPLLMTMFFAGLGMAMSSWLLVVLPVIALTPSPLGGLGLDPSQQTHLAAVFALAGSLAGFGVGYALRRRSGGTVAIVVMVSLVVGYTVAYLGRTSTASIAIATLAIGIGGAGGITVAYNLIIRLVAPQRQAVMSSTFSLFFNMLASIASVALFAVMNSLGTTDAATGIVVYNSHAFAAATLIPLIASVVALGFAIALRTTRAGRTAVDATSPTSLPTSEPQTGFPALATADLEP